MLTKFLEYRMGNFLLRGGKDLIRYARDSSGSQELRDKISHFHGKGFLREPEEEADDAREVKLPVPREELRVQAVPFEKLRGFYEACQILKEQNFKKCKESKLQ